MKQCLTIAFGLTAILAMSAHGQSLERGYIDVNFGLAMAGDDQFTGNALLPFDAGADVSYFFTRVFGVGGVARFSRGTASLDGFDADDTGVDEFKAGGFHVGGGIRLKF